MSSQEAQGRYRWLWNRLRCMTPAEVVHRAQQAVLSKLQRPLSLLSVDREALEGADELPQGLDPSPYLHDADRILAGEVQLFSRDRRAVGARPDWHRCPLTGVVCPALRSSAIAITNRQLVGDIKYLWELNRHLQWVTLAQAARLSGDARYVQGLSLQLRDWLDQCKAGQGPNWTSSLELAIRLINWARVWRLCGNNQALFAGDAGQALRRDWLASIQLHVREIGRNYSRHSSANNHLVGELAGVYVAARQWPCWAEVRSLGDKALKELQREAALQITPSGVGREQAFAYQVFVAEFLLVVAVTASTHGDGLGADLPERLGAMMGFVRALRCHGGHVPNVGDADDAEVVRLDPSPHKARYDVMLQMGARLFGRTDWLTQDMAPRDDAHWLVPEPLLGRLQSAQPVVLDHADGGYQLFEAAAGTPRELKGFIDTGPLGYLGIAAHGHADALQVGLAVGGQDLLTDPGTYSYWADKAWRDHFRGTAAHNTLCAARQDQSESGGRFMWLRKATTSVQLVQRQANGGLRVQASHDGYNRLASRRSHQRSLSFDARRSALEIVDTTQGLADDELQLHWHLAPGWEASLDGDTLVLASAVARVTVQVQSDTPGRLELIVGRENPPQGWVSLAYQHKIPSPTLRWSARATRAVVTTRVGVQWPALGIEEQSLMEKLA